MRLLLLAAVVLSLGFAPAPLPRIKKLPNVETVRRQLEGIWVVEGYSVGGRVQGGPGPTWLAVRIERGTWSQTSKIDGRLLQTTPYRITLDPKDATRIDMAYKPGDRPLLYGTFRLTGDRLIVTHATSGPLPSSHQAPLLNAQVRWVLRRGR